MYIYVWLRAIKEYNTSFIGSIISLFGLYNYYNIFTRFVSIHFLQKWHVVNNKLLYYFQFKLENISSKYIYVKLYGSEYNYTSIYYMAPKMFLISYRMILFTQYTHFLSVFIMCIGMFKKHVFFKKNYNLILSNIQPRGRNQIKKDQNLNLKL